MKVTILTNTLLVFLIFFQCHFANNSNFNIYSSLSEQSHGINKNFIIFYRCDPAYGKNFHGLNKSVSIPCPVTTIFFDGKRKLSDEAVKTTCTSFSASRNFHVTVPCVYQSPIRL